MSEYKSHAIYNENTYIYNGIIYKVKCKHISITNCVDFYTCYSCSFYIFRFLRTLWNENNAFVVQRH